MPYVIGPYRVDYDDLNNQQVVINEDGQVIARYATQDWDKARNHARELNLGRTPPDYPDRQPLRLGDLGFEVINWKEVPSYKLPELCGTNAQKWAEAFCQIVRPSGPGGERFILDEGLMIGWFANCIEQTKIEIQKEAPSNRNHG